jgi:hypothetical protein
VSLEDELRDEDRQSGTPEKLYDGDEWHSPMLVPSGYRFIRTKDGETSFAEA